MEKMNEIRLPKGVDRIAVKQHDDRIVIEFIPEKSKFKEGDFVYENGRIMIVKSYPNMYHAHIYPEHSNFVCYNDWYWVDFSEPTFMHASDVEKQILIDAMKKDGKRWNAEKLEIEDIPQPKFKDGDKVKIKDGISSETHRYVSPNFTEYMDKFIGKELTVIEYTESGNVQCNNHFIFHEDWLEPWSDEPKVGDWVVAWDVNRKAANVGILEAVGGEGELFKYVVNGFEWINVVKWNGTIEHLEKIRKG